MNAKTTFPVLVALLGAALLNCAANDEAAGSTGQNYTAAQCAAAQPWAEWKSYATGDLVTYSGSTYACVQGHPSGPGWTPAAVAALWTPVACVGGTNNGGGGTQPPPSGTTGGNGGGNTGSGPTCDP